MYTKIKPWELLCTQNVISIEKTTSELKCKICPIRIDLVVYSRDEQQCPQSTKMPVESPYYYFSPKHAIFVHIYVK